MAAWHWPASVLVLVPALATRYADRSSLSLVNRRSRIRRFNDCPRTERRWQENLESRVEYLPASLPSYLSDPPPLTAAALCPFGVTTIPRGGSIGSVQLRSSAGNGTGSRRPQQIMCLDPVRSLTKGKQVYGW